MRFFWSYPSFIEGFPDKIFHVHSVPSYKSNRNMSLSCFDICTKKSEITSMEKTWEDLIIEAMRAYAAGFPSVRAAADGLGMSYETFRSWHDGIKSPTIKNLSPYAKNLGLLMPHNSGEDTRRLQRRIEFLESDLEKTKNEKTRLEGAVSMLEHLLEKAQAKLQEQARALPLPTTSDLSTSDDNQKTLKAV